MHRVEFLKAYTLIGKRLISYQVMGAPEREANYRVFQLALIY